MQSTSVLYDGRAAATPSQLREHSLRDARIERIKALALPDRPIVCLSAHERAARIVVLAPKPEPIPFPPSLNLDFSDFSGMWFYDLIRASQGISPAPPPPRRISIEEIQRVVASHYGVTRHDILSERRTAAVVRPRQVAVFLAKTLTLKSLPEIGRHTGKRDHTTILSSIRKITRLLETEPGLAETVDVLTRKIQKAGAA